MSSIASLYKNSSSYLLILLNILACYFFASRGIDLTDQGYPLAISDWLNPYFFLSLGSVLVNKLLVVLFSNYALLASKFIAQVIPLTIVFFSYKLLLRNNAHKQTYLPLLLLIIFWSNRVTLSEWTYYNTLSTLLISLAIIFMYQGIEAIKFSNLYISLVFLFLSVICKISNLVFLIYIPIFIFFFYKKNKDNTYLNKKIRNFITLSVVLVITLFLVVCLSSLQAYFVNAFSSALQFISQSNSYSFQATYQNIWRDGSVYLRESIIFSVYLIALLLVNKYSITAKKILIVTLSAIFVALQYYLKLYEWNGLLFFYIISLIYLFLSKDCKEYKFLSISCLLFLLLSFLGSANGLKPAFVSETIICIVLIIVFIRKIKNTFLVSAVVVTLAIIGLINKTIFTYRDLNKLELSATSNIPKLAGIYSHQSKIELLEELYNLRKSLESTSTTALIYPSAPLLHYILDLTPSLPNPWVNLYPDEQLINNLNSLKTLPNFIIRLKQNPRTKDWPNNLQALDKDRNYSAITIIDNYITSNGYELLKDTSSYYVYRMQ